MRWSAARAAQASCASRADLPGLNALNSSDVESGVGFGDRARQIDSTAGIFDDEALKSQGRAIDRGETDAEVVGQPAKEEAIEAAFVQVSGKPGGGEVIVLQKGRVGVDMAAEALAEDEFCLGNVERGMEGSAGRALDAMLGPERLRPVRSLDHLKGLLARMSGGKGDMTGGMPVLGEDDVVEFFAESIDQRDDLIAISYRKRSAGAEVVLDVDDQKRIAGLWRNRHLLMVLLSAGRGAAQRL